MAAGKNRETGSLQETNAQVQTEAEKLPEDLSIEESFEKLDALLERLEDREIPLEEAFALYQQGLQLMVHCNEKIDTVEKKVQVMNEDGSFDEFD